MDTKNEPTDSTTEPQPKVEPSDSLDTEENLDEDTEIVTMVDVLQEETELEDNADAGKYSFLFDLWIYKMYLSFTVLGGSDDSQCTHRDEKAFRRQALYACKTCAEEIGIWQAGICLACSYVCHDKHELYELYTKRAFKCDCGLTSKFPGKKCSFIADKHDADNEANSYNQNFRGKYCTCERPYPDPEDHEEDEMIQCVSCEDWFHGRHLVGHVPDNDDFSEMVCHKCMSKLSFLWNYYDRDTVTKRIKRDEGEAEQANSHDASIETERASETSSDPVQAKGDDSPQCVLKQKKQSNPSDHSGKTGATFWDANWRKQLCSCGECISLYKELGCSYLTDSKDTVHYYESENRQKDARCSSSSSMERGMEAFGHMPRPQQIEMLHSYNDLQTALKDYLKTFAEEKKVVTKEDINKFFEDFNRSRSSRVPSQLISTCR